MDTHSLTWGKYSVAAILKSKQHTELPYHIMLKNDKNWRNFECVSEKLQVCQNVTGIRI